MAAATHLPVSSFQVAIDTFKGKSGLSSQELVEMKMTSLSDLQRTLATMQEEQKSSKTMKFLKRLQPFLDAMEQYSNAISVFANASDVVAFIWVCILLESLCFC